VALFQEAELILSTASVASERGQKINPSLPQYSMKNTIDSQLTPTNKPSNNKRWLYGIGVALALGVVGAVAAVRHNPDLLMPAIQAGVPLNWARGWSVVDFAIKRAETPTINSQEMKKIVDSKDPSYLILDVRTPEEYKISHIPGAVLVPLTEIEQGSGVQKVKSMLNGRHLVAYCTHGYRSGRALVKLKDAGVEGTQYPGGIQEWTQKIDPSLPRNGW
jgi:rhodanese-related sulfurtransferase